ncbi:RodZ family helix-turn-helix domain-containing protein [Aggregatibacter sp. 2125159857]|uniref:RodZ domain-containing protein n=1 Tax=Aggregatibacter sp. 2125159857 TaxID=2820817 RepID=UPI001ADFDAB8|nr:RodZ family helix-turn-helix domain-containing protein [Aggregatibacter sp. 2125159857]QTO02112.1 helix-turn-helix domain-containing protein [Aggregatibacter sp. 2125159857]
MNTQECQTDSPEITLGDKFRIAREALHLSLEEVAEAIALRPSILKTLEENQFVNAAVPATFMRGYVRNYAKFLRIPESEWTNLVHFGHDQENDLGKNARATHAVNQYTSHHRWIGYLTALVVLIVIGMTGMWWWENHQHTNEERDNLVNAYTQTMATTSTPAAVSNDKPQDATGVITATGSTTGSSVTSAPTTPSANESSTPAPTNALQAEMDKITGMKSASTAEATTAQQPQQQSAVENASVSAAATKEALYIEVIGNCWISVKDKNRKVLAQKEYKQGDVLNFSEGEPYSLIIGAPANVKITYKGEAFPLTVDGRVAKFKLPQ